MNLQTLAIELSDAGHHDLVERLVEAHLAEVAPPADERTASFSPDVHLYDKLLQGACSVWLVACELAHSPYDTKTTYLFLRCAQQELQHTTSIGKRIAQAGFTPKALIQPVPRFTHQAIDARRIMIDELAQAVNLTASILDDLDDPLLREIIDSRDAMINELR